MKKKYILSVLSFFFLASLTAQNTIGLLRNEPGAFEGYTLFATSGYTSTYLIDNCGQLINEWPGEYRPGSVNYLLEDGHLYRAVRNIGGDFIGGGIGGQVEKLDWDGNLVWSYKYGSDLVHQHHDIEVLPNGNVLILAWEARSNQAAIEAGRDPFLFDVDLWPEQIIEVEPFGASGGTIVWEWHLWDHLIQDFDDEKDNFGEVSAHPELVDINFKGFTGSFIESDWIHANAVDYNSSRDEIVISSRHFSEFWIIDHSTTTAEAASHSGGNSGKGGDILYRWGNPIAYKRGTQADKKLFGQHDVHWIPEGLPGEGEIMVYNNGLNRPGGNAASVDVLQPPIDSDGNYISTDTDAFGPSDLSWTYFPSVSENFYSSTLSGAQRLPNGNTLICEGNKGRFFEVDENGNKLWEYICPINSGGPFTQGENPASNSVFRAYRYAPDFSAFDGKDLTPGAVLELNPLPTVCDDTTANNEIDEELWSVFPNPVNEKLFINNPQGEIGEIKLINALGEVMYAEMVETASFEIITKDLQEGMYFLFLDGKVVKKVLCQHF